MISNPTTLIVAGRGRWAAIFILVLVAAGACWHSYQTVRAAPFTTWNVSVGSLGTCTSGDPNCATIGAAAAAAAADDTINVAAGTYNEWDIVIDKNLTIIGAGANTTIVNANQAGRVFQTCCGIVNISGLTIKNGLTVPTGPPARPGKIGMTTAANPLIDGGGIYNATGGTLNLTSCTISDNATAMGSSFVNPQPPSASRRFAHVSSSGLTTQQIGGVQGGLGGGIFNAGTLNLTACTVFNNRTGFGSDSDIAGGDGGDGGGIYNVGILTVTNSTITNNRTGKGGNIFSLAAPSTNAAPSAVSGPGNGGEGGGIANDAGGTLILRNSTIADNETGPAGQFLNPIPAATRARGALVPTPPVGPIGGNGGGIYSGSVLTTISCSSTLIATNRVEEGGSGPDVFTDSPVNSQGYNLVGIEDGSTGFTQPTDQKGTGIAPLNPLLGPLANNGGPTQTMALLGSSPAIDKGINGGCSATPSKGLQPALVCGLPFDQRGTGFPRTVDLPAANAADGTDVGAFEVQPSDLTITKTHVGNFTSGDTARIYTITVTNSGSGATSGNVSVSDIVPAGLVATAITGNNWNCAQPAGPCTRSDSLGAGNSYEPITLTVNVACGSPLTVTNTAQVAGGGEVNVSNNTASDPTTVNPGTGLPLSITCPGGITRFADSGQRGATISPGTPVVTGGCVPVTVTGVRSDGRPLNALYPIGVTLITWTATDAGGNQVSCGQSIAVMVPSGERKPVGALP